MKNFLEKNTIIIVLILLVLLFFKSCGDSQKMSKINANIEAIKAEMKDSLCSKGDILLITNEVTEMKTTLWGAMDSWAFIMDKFVDTSVKNKVNKEAWSMFSKEMESQREKSKIKK